ncbi:flagellar biosynthetic protein FliQ [Buchnera aphidicola]|nr:flagellar biosynthetic protein FliQ [Buchnera aphidicola]USS94186.1 flagellar biosynthetic protein FliQ [Buchnera aphidicola (Sipha maydis)]WII23734.1 flagellar biosynthetic protein FliQ [Buchnera aphidicola (Sipha maydis)]
MKNVFLDAIKILFLLSCPLLFSVFFVAVIISTLQAATQINEQTLSFIPKIITVFIILFFFGPWMIDVLIQYINSLFKSIIYIIAE